MLQQFFSFSVFLGFRFFDVAVDGVSNERLYDLLTNKQSNLRRGIASSGENRYAVDNGFIRLS